MTPPPSASDRMPAAAPLQSTPDAPLLFILSAPSGSGKSTLVRELLRLVPGLEFSISYTTRPPRGSEVHGREYFFIGRNEFEAMRRAGDFLETAEVFGYHYGTAWHYLEDARRQGRDLLLDIDVQGAALVRARRPDAIGIFIAPPDRKTLEWRLRNRGQDSEAAMETRLRDASREIAAYNKYDYLLLNDRLEESVERLSAIVESERARARGPRPEESESDRRHREALAASCRREAAAQRLVPVLRSFGIADP